MKTILLLLCGACLVGCASKDTFLLDAPRAIPVKPVIAQLDKRIKAVSHKAEDVQKQAEHARDNGLAPGSKEGHKLVQDVQVIRHELDIARSEITQISERADALVVERDAFAKQARELAERNRAQGNKLAVADSKKRFWIVYSGITTLLITLFILYKLARIYSISLNPLQLLR